jgi:hypothetical protein
LIASLGDRSFEARRKAAAELVALGPAALPALDRAAEADDAEVARQARECAAVVRTATDPALTAAAIRLVARKAPEGSADVLLELLPHTEGDLAAEVRSALCELARRDPTVREKLGGRLAAWESQPGRRLYPVGVKVAHRVTYRYERTAIPVQTLDLTGVQFFNRLDDKLFARPDESGDAK